MLSLYLSLFIFFSLLCKSFVDSFTKNTAHLHLQKCTLRACTIWTGYVQTFTLQAMHLWYVCPYDAPFHKVHHEIVNLSYSEIMDMTHIADIISLFSLFKKYLVNENNFSKPQLPSKIVLKLGSANYKSMFCCLHN